MRVTAGWWDLLVDHVIAMGTALVHFLGKLALWKQVVGCYVLDTSMSALHEEPASLTPALVACEVVDLTVVNPHVVVVAHEKIAKSDTTVQCMWIDTQGTATEAPVASVRQLESATPLFAVADATQTPRCPKHHLLAPDQMQHVQQCLLSPIVLNWCRRYVRQLLASVVVAHVVSVHGFGSGFVPWF